MLSNRFNPGARRRSWPRPRTIEAFGGRGCFLSGAFLGGPFANGWRLERGAVLDIGPHLLDLLEVGLGRIMHVQAVGDPLGWVSVDLHARIGRDQQRVDVLPRRDREPHRGRGVRAEGFGDVRRKAARRAEWAEELCAVVGAARGEEHAANVHRALHLQELIADIESQL